METKKNSESEAKAGSVRKIVTTLVVLIVLVVLALAARYVVGSIDIVQLLKSLHGG